MPLLPIELDHHGDIIIEQALQIARLAKYNPAKLVGVYRPDEIARAVRRASEAADGTNYLVVGKPRRAVSHFGKTPKVNTKTRVIYRPKPLVKEGSGEPVYPNLIRVKEVLLEWLAENPRLNTREAAIRLNAEGHTNLYGLPWTTNTVGDFKRRYNVPLLPGYGAPRPKGLKRKKRKEGPRRSTQVVLAFAAERPEMQIHEICKAAIEAGLKSARGKPYKEKAIRAILRRHGAQNPMARPNASEALKKVYANKKAPE